MGILEAILIKVVSILFLLAFMRPLFRYGLSHNKFKVDGFMFKLATIVNTRHQIIGKLCLLTALIHGLIGNVKILSFNWGTICFVAIIISIIPCRFHKEGKKDKPRLLHILLSIVAFGTFVTHIVMSNI
jgi:hypothetical protein